MSSELYDIEAESLPAHISICQERYKQLESRIESVEKKLLNIDITLCEIRDEIKKDREGNFRLFLTWAGVIITTLIGTSGYLIAHYVLR